MTKDNSKQRIVWHEDELTPDVPFSEITILQQGEISIIDNQQLINNKRHGQADT